MILTVILLILQGLRPILPPNLQEPFYGSGDMGSSGLEDHFTNLGVHVGKHIPDSLVGHIPTTSAGSTHAFDFTFGSDGSRIHDP